MSEIWIERLVLEIPGLSKSDSRRLALQVSEGLGSVGAAGGGLDIPTVRLDLTAAVDKGVDELARQIVAEVLRELDRLS